MNLEDYRKYCLSLGDDEGTEVPGTFVPIERLPWRVE